MNTRIYIVILLAIIFLLADDTLAQQSQTGKIESFLKKYHEYGLFNGSALV